MTRTLVLYGPRLSLVMLRSQQARLISCHNSLVTARAHNRWPRLRLQGAASHMDLLKLAAVFHKGNVREHCSALKPQVPM